MQFLANLPFILLFEPMSDRLKFPAKTTRHCCVYCLLCAAMLCLGACRQTNSSNQATSDDEIPPPGELRLISVTPIPPEESAPYIWFTGKSASSKIKNGSFEDWYSDQLYPNGWQPLATGPSAVRERSIVKQGDWSVRLSSENETRMQPLIVPTADELRGHHVYFGGWMYSENPDRVGVQVIEDWKMYHVARPKQINTWELVMVDVDIAPETKDVLFAFTVGLATAAGSCYVDGAALVIK